MRASSPANKLIADIKQLSRGGRHSYLITEEQGLRVLALQQAS